MKFRELVEINHEVHVCVSYFGAEKEALEAIEHFQQVMRQTVSPLELKNPDFFDREVPEEIAEAFKPLYNMYIGMSYRYSNPDW